MDGRRLCGSFLISLLIVASVASAVPTMAPAIPILQSKDFSGTPNLSESLTFAKFNTMGGTRVLYSVEVTLGLNVSGGGLVLDNDSDTGANGIFEFGAKGSISSSDVSLLSSTLFPITAEVEALHSDNFTLGANVDDTAWDWSPLGPDGMQYNGGQASDSASGAIADMVFGQYIGSGTFNIDVDVIQWLDYSSVSGIECAFTPVNALGYVDVVYGYTVVPEPVTVSLLGLGGLLIRRKRK